MESDLQHHQLHHHLLDHHQYQPPQKQMNSGLTRYSSAPSSYFSSFIDRELSEFLNRPSSPETERIFARFLSSSSAAGNNNNTEDTTSDHNFSTISQNNSATEVEQQNQIMESMNEEKPVIQKQQSSYSSASQQSFYQAQNQQHLSNQDSGSGMDYKPVTSMGMDRLPPMKTGGGNNSNLIRHSSSPADFFAYINADSGYTEMRGMGDYGGGNNTNREASFSSASKPPTSSSAVRMRPISEMGKPVSSPSRGGFVENRSNDYSTNFPMSSSWDDSSMMSDTINDSNRLREEDRTFSGLNASDTKIEEGANRPPRLAHHLSLPTKISAEMSAIEKFLQFPDSVPCKIRAKRGCATHPRSIAERVRRTKISERMRKLQELVPNMDKQTNTADMLDLAVDYIKDLQRQFKTLSDHRAKCTCSNKQQQ